MTKNANEKLRNDKNEHARGTFHLLHPLSFSNFVECYCNGKKLCSISVEDDLARLEIIAELKF